MNTRIKIIRKHYDKTQKEFGESLGVSRDTYASYESGRVEPSKTFIQLLCATYHVNRKWLESGEGDMDEFTADDFVNEIAPKFNLDDIDKEIIRTYLKTPLLYRGFCKDALKLIVDGNYDTFLKDQKKPHTQRLDYQTDTKTQPRPGGDKVVETVFPDAETIARENANITYGQTILEQNSKGKLPRSGSTKEA